MLIAMHTLRTAFKDKTKTSVFYVAFFAAWLIQISYKLLLNRVYLFPADRIQDCWRITN